MFLKAVLLFRNEEIVTCTDQVALNADKFGSDIRQAFLSPVGDGYYGISFGDPQKPGTLNGVWAIVDGQGLVIDAASVDEVIDALNGCCGDDPVITPQYNGEFPSEFEAQAATYTFTRVDDGDASAMLDFQRDYDDNGNFIPSGFLRTAYDANTRVSTYQFKAYRDPAPHGNDIKTGETNRVFTSDAAGALGAGQQYQLQVFVNGVRIDTPLTGATLNALVTAANAGDQYNDYGTYATSGGKITLSSSTTNGATLDIDIIPA